MAHVGPNLRVVRCGRLPSFATIRLVTLTVTVVRPQCLLGADVAFIYLVVLRDDDASNVAESASDSSFVEEAFDQTMQFVKGAWVIATDIATSGDVMDKLGVSETGSRTGWSTIVVPMTEFNGFAEQSLWEKINEWRRSS